jgi:peptide/nickel transport system substrate-binding protein
MTRVRLRAGQLDMITSSSSPEQVEVLQSQDGLSVLSAVDFVSIFLAINNGAEPFNLPEFRQAMALSIDRNILVEDVYLDAAYAGEAGWVHPEAAWHDSSVKTVFDPEAAMNLMDDAGIKDSDNDGVREYKGKPLSFDFLAGAGDPLRLRLAENISGQLSEVGIKAVVSAMESESLDEKVWPEFNVAVGRNYDMSIFGWGAPTQLDLGKMGALVHSDPVKGNLNITGFRDKVSDEIADRLSKEIDQDKRYAVSAELQKRFAEQMPMIPLVYPKGNYAYNSDVYGGWQSVRGIGPITKMSFIPDAESF